MITPRVGFGFKFKTAARGFFDRPAVEQAMDRASRRVFSRFGAFVRQIAKTSIRRRRDSAPPGSPPSSHTGLLRRFIFFFWDPSTRSVVIGPAALNQRAAAVAPALLEYGGSVHRKAQTIQVPVDMGRDHAGKFLKRGFRTVVVPAGIRTYRARPFMQPAFDATLPKLDAMWSGAIKP